MTNKNALLVPFCLILGYFNLAFAVLPKISYMGDESQDLVIKAGDNFNATCQGNKPLRWITPKLKYGDHHGEKYSWTSFTTTNLSSPHSSMYNFGSVLHIKNMSYPFVGYYTCVYADDFDSTSEKAEIYLFVNDPDHLSVMDEDEFAEAIVATQNKEVTLPCRPTAPDVSVQLISDEEIDSSYDPRTGFTFLVTDLSMQNLYTCMFSKNNNNQEIMIFLNVNPARTHLITPLVEDTNQNHTDIGDTIRIKCSLKEISSFIKFAWDTPRGRIESGTERKQEGEYLVDTLVVNNAQLEDSGLYICNVADRQGHEEKSEINIIVHSWDECFIKMTEENNVLSIEVDAGESPRWIIQVEGHPIPELKWLDQNGEVIETNSKYAVNVTTNLAYIEIKNVSIMDSGIYTLYGKSSRSHVTQSCPAEQNLNLELIVYDKPSVDLISQEIYVINSTATMECRATGNPIPVIIWEEKECLEENCKFKEVLGTNYTTGRFQNISMFQVNTSHEGSVKCSAYNALNSNNGDYSIAQYYISDIKNGFDIYNFGDTAFVSNDNGDFKEVLLAKGDVLSLTCAVSPKKSMNIQIAHNGEEVNDYNDKGYSLSKTLDPFSLKSNLKIKNAQEEHSGNYTCRIRDISDFDRFFYKTVEFIVTDAVQPEIIETNMVNTTEMEFPNLPHKFYCKFTGIPKPSIEWYKNDEPLLLSDNMYFLDSNQKLIFKKTQLSDEGCYKCVVSNSMGTVSQEAKLQFKYKQQSVLIYYYIMGAIGLLFIIALIVICVKTRKERQLKRELKLLGLENFEKGNPENLNPDLGIDDQAELLPYNKKFEFPIEQLKLGKQLGSGAFGVVMKGEARRIVEDEEKTTVAVKMVKKNADHTYIRALASELKIMVHLGKHINVVNLLGACTKNVAKRELLVIVEYCRFGNVQNYLLRHRESFINQVDPTNGKINYYIGSDILNRSFSTSSENGSKNMSALQYAQLAFSDSSGEPTTPNSMQDYRGRSNTEASRITQMTTLPNTHGDESVLLSNNSIQPEWRSNYRGDYKGNVRPVSTKDLVAWSFQVARGMDYLASRKVLHGDLAARNILLSDNNIVKICDFGLAKTMYNDNNYKKKGNGPLPVKWMAIESIRDRVFSTQSDVWSFGIVLWELFSLARMPYPGMDPDERLYYKLVDGYRMEAPQYAPKAIYTIMLQCWDVKPLARPSFTELTERIGYLLDDSDRKHYVDLNDPYLAINTRKREEENDYLAMLTPPSFEVLSTPPAHYNNEMILPSPNPMKKEEEGYTFMGGNKPPNIFSPRVIEDEVFDFGSKGKRNQHNFVERKTSQEIRPMLHSQAESDHEGYLIPDIPINSISNPSYQMGPLLNANQHDRRNINDNESGIVDKTNVQNEILSSPDNYVNVPQYKNLVGVDSTKYNNDRMVKINMKDNNSRVQYVNGDNNLWNSIDV